MHFKKKFRETLSWKNSEIEIFIIVLLFETNDCFGSSDELKLHQLC